MSYALHSIAALAHGAQAAYSVVLGSNESTPVFPVKYRGKTLFTTELWPFVAGFAALSTVNHAASVMFWDKYQSFVGDARNPWRWAEYALSAGIMLALVSQLSGVYEADILTVIFVGVMLLMSLGHIIEITADPRKARMIFVVGFVLMLALWLFPTVSFYDAIQRSERNPPDVVYVILITMFVLYSSFGGVSWLQLTRRGSESWFADYRNVETSYLVLSLIAKTLLTNLTLFGVLFRPQDTIDIMPNYAGG